jgi:hypothetical protein
MRSVTSALRAKEERRAEPPGSCCSSGPSGRMDPCPSDDVVRARYELAVIEDKHRDEALSSKSPDLLATPRYVGQLPEAVDLDHFRRMAGFGYRVVGPFARVRPGTPGCASPRPRDRKRAPANVELHPLTYTPVPEERGSVEFWFPAISVPIPVLEFRFRVNPVGAALLLLAQTGAGSRIADRPSAASRFRVDRLRVCRGWPSRAPAGLHIGRRSPRRRPNGYRCCVSTGGRRARICGVT